MNEIQVTVVGNVAGDVRHGEVRPGLRIASFRLASTPRRFDRSEDCWVDGRTNFVTVTCWRWLADNVASCVGKGDPVIVVGRLRTREWERAGRRGNAVEIEAQAVGHDLTRGTSAFRRTTRGEAMSDGGVVVNLDAVRRAEMTHEMTQGTAHGLVGDDETVGGTQETVEEGAEEGRGVVPRLLRDPAA